MKRVFETVEFDEVRNSIFFAQRHENHENQIKGCVVELKKYKGVTGRWTRVDLVGLRYTVKGRRSTCMVDDRYALKVKETSLNLIRHSIGSHWSCLKRARLSLTLSWWISVARYNHYTQQSRFTSVTGSLILSTRQVICWEFSRCFNDANICLWTDGSSLTQSAAQTACEQRNSFLPRITNNNIQSKLAEFRSAAGSLLGRIVFWIDVRAVDTNDFHWIDGSPLARQLLSTHQRWPTV